EARAGEGAAVDEDARLGERADVRAVDERTVRQLHVHHAEAVRRDEADDARAAALGRAAEEGENLAAVGVVDGAESRGSRIRRTCGVEIVAEAVDIDVLQVLNEVHVEVEFDNLTG